MFDFATQLFDDIEYEVHLVNWKSNSIQLFFNFSDPLAISQSSLKNKLSMKIKDPEIFMARATGITLDDE